MIGSTIWSRKTLESAIFRKKPDKWFKIWFYLVSKVNHQDNELFIRGENFTNYSEIRYITGAKKTEIDTALRWMKSEGMITTQKTTRGFKFAIVNYAKYQDSIKRKDDEKSTRHGTRQTTRQTTATPHDTEQPDGTAPLSEKTGIDTTEHTTQNSQTTRQTTATSTVTINNKLINNKQEDIYKGFAFLSDPNFKQLYRDYLDMRKAQKKPATEAAEKITLKKLHDHSLEEAKAMLEQSIVRGWVGLFPANSPQPPASVHGLTAGRTITGLKIIRSGSSWIRKDTSEPVDPELVKQGVLNENEWVARKNMLWKQKTAACGKCKDGWLTTPTGEKFCECIKEIYLI